MFSFDPIIRLDTVVVALAALGTIAVGWGIMRSELQTLAQKVGKVETAIGEQTSMLVDIARQDQQLKDIERRINMLER